MVDSDHKMVAHISPDEKVILDENTVHTSILHYKSLSTHHPK